MSFFCFAFLSIYTVFKYPQGGRKEKFIKVQIEMCSLQEKAFLTIQVFTLVASETNNYVYMQQD